MSPNVNGSDEALLAQSRRGDEEAFAVLMRRYEQPLFHYLQRMLGNAAEAEDVFQETFLKVHLHADRFQEGMPFRPWLYRIATNVCRDRQRYWWRRPQVRWSPALGNRVAAVQADPGAAAQESETMARLEKAIARLSVKHRAVFLMARYDGMSYEEISEALQVPLGTVKSRMNRAVNQLMSDVKEPDR